MTHLSQKDTIFQQSQQLTSRKNHEDREYTIERTVSKRATNFLKNLCLH